MTSLTKDLLAPKGLSEFNHDWARRILVDYTQRQDPEWLLASVLKVVELEVKENPHPGNLSDSYIADVTYRMDSGTDWEGLSEESWFIKIPKSDVTSTVDEVEVFMYTKMFEYLQCYAERTCRKKNEIQMPIPIVFHAHFSENIKGRDQIVMENLRDQGYKPLRPETCGLVFMRAAMSALATVHATGYGYQESCGGRKAFLERYPIIKDQNRLPKFSEMKGICNALITPYLAYMSRVQPDIAPQLGMLNRYAKVLLPVFAEIGSKNAKASSLDPNNQKQGVCANLDPLKTLVHGDSKIDNFMFKAVSRSYTVDGPDDVYNAVIVDWQGSCYDYLSSDLMWTLYGFMKNLPEKNSTIDSFLDYSIQYYHQELMRILKELKVDPSSLGLPENEYDIVMLVRKAFIHNFLKVAIIKPCLTIKNPELLFNWFATNYGGVENDSEKLPLPEEEEIFKNGSNFVNFVHLYIVIATEIGALHDLGPLCVNAMKETMFEGKEVLDKMLRDADEANRDPDEIDNTVDVKDAKKDADELKDIMNDLKGQVEEKTGETVEEDNEKTNTNDLNEDDKPSNVDAQKEVTEDENNNSTVESKNEDVQEPQKEVLSIDQIYNKPITTSIATQTDLPKESTDGDSNPTPISNQQCDSASLISTDNAEERQEETKSPSHLGPPSFSPPPLPSNILSDSLATNEQHKEAFTGTNGYNSVENEESTANKLTNGDLSNNLVSNHAPRLDHSESEKENVSLTTSELQTDPNESTKETKSKRRFMGKRCRPRKKSNANADQVKAFENKIKGCHK